MGSERQKHGFMYEEIIEKRYRIDRSNQEYTSAWDGFLNGIPVSIKTEKLGSDIELGDFRRNAENTQSFYLFVGFWNGDKTNIQQEEVLFINGDEWHTLFPQHFIKDFSNMLENISNDRRDDTRWKAMIAEQRKKWRAETNNYIRPRFKRDHKKQKRIQCAINYNDFYNYFIPKYKVEEANIDATNN